MEEWLCLVVGALGMRDFSILIQVPRSKFGKEMIEGLLFGGFEQLLGLDKDRGKISKVEVNRVDTTQGSIQNRNLAGHVYKRSHFLIQVSGVKVGEKHVNDFMIYVQIPKAQDGQQDQKAVEAMVLGGGLAPFLGRYVKQIVPRRIGETGAAQWEEVGASLVLS